jgi:hypothetical protein
MRAGELLFAVACALCGAALSVAVRLSMGDWISPVVSYSLLIIGVGAALVSVRYGRLGPFEGELGPPRLESELRDRVRHEVERAVRYDREFSVLAVRQAGGRDRLRSSIRGVDEVIPCRRGLTLLLLPETPRDGALAVLSRLANDVNVPILAALVSCPADGRSADALLTELLQLAHGPSAPGKVAMRSKDVTETLAVSA